MKFVFEKIPTCGRLHLTGRCPECAAPCSITYHIVARGVKEIECYKCKNTFVIKKVKDDQKVIALVEKKANKNRRKDEY